MTPGDQAPDTPSGATKETVARAFGAGNRARLLARYFEMAGSVTPANAWQHVYRLLLWIDRTTRWPIATSQTKLNRDAHGMPGRLPFTIGYLKSSTSLPQSWPKGLTGFSDRRSRTSRTGLSPAEARAMNVSANRMRAAHFRNLEKTLSWLQSFVRRYRDG